MNTQTRFKPTWVLLFTLGPLAAGLLLLAHYEILSTPWRQLVEIGIVLLICGLAEVWTRMNSFALLGNVPSQTKREMTEVSPPFSLAPLPSRQFDLTAEGVSQVFGEPAGLAKSSGSDDPEFETRLTPPSFYLHPYGDENLSPTLN